MNFIHSAMKISTLFRNELNQFNIFLKNILFTKQLIKFPFFPHSSERKRVSVCKYLMKK